MTAFVTVERHANGITINSAMECLLTVAGDPMFFPSVEEATSYMLDHGEEPAHLLFNISSIRYPELKVVLTEQGPAGNVLVMMAKMQVALRLHKVSSLRIDEFVQEVFAGDYEDFKRTCKEWVTVVMEKS